MKKNNKVAPHECKPRSGSPTDQVNNCTKSAKLLRAGSPWAPHLSQPVHQSMNGTPKAIGALLFPGPHLCGSGPGDFPRQNST
ncbi:hypothetical protein TIFTF001_022877 [Ficus carica]|uniref:Uncharacterized protein n=1 Tax=Ficus carica TaxID=3494 RepID=A0AA88AMM9_FICCA|nr:hypothetical protein TIFTF001_022877 [Ficus carica]